MSRDMTMIVQQLVNGITQGGLYALLAISYALVYGVMNLVNFSTGSIYMLGAIGGWAVCNFITEDFFLSIAVGFVVGFVAAFILEKLAFKSIRGISRISSLICTIGFSQLINELMDSFGEKDIILASSLALVARRMDAESPASD